MLEMNIRMPDDKAQLDESGLDATRTDKFVERMKESPLCCRCGANLRGVPRNQVVQCPRCKEHMRHVGAIWLERVSHLDLSMSPMPAPTRGLGKKFNGRF
jgi:tRNA(Ile2) C34 agmatinyltransferase TiaS